MKLQFIVSSEFHQENCYRTYVSSMKLMIRYQIMKIMVLEFKKLKNMDLYTMRILFIMLFFSINLPQNT